MIERLDETIDRVASELTDVPSDPHFASRLRKRLRESPPSWLGLRQALAVAAAIVAIVFATWQLFEDGRSKDGPLQENATVASTVAPDGATADKPLAPPAPLAPEITALAVPPVSVAPLEVADLEIIDLGDGSEFEEPR